MSREVQKDFPDLYLRDLQHMAEIKQESVLRYVDELVRQHQTAEGPILPSEALQAPLPDVKESHRFLPPGWEI
jgi:hypothetical protein